jgi:hypothetical protein
MHSSFKGTTKRTPMPEELWQILQLKTSLGMVKKDRNNQVFGVES